MISTSISRPLGMGISVPITGESGTSAPAFTSRSAILDGDSLSLTQIWVQTATNMERRAGGYWTNASALLFQMYSTRKAQSFGASGHNIAQILSGQSTAVAYVEANNIQDIVLQLGANDVEDTSRTVAALKTDYQTLITTYLACTNAPYVFVGIPTPRADWEDAEGTNETNRAIFVQRLHDIRTALADIVTTLANPKCKLFDSWNDIVDPAVTNTTTGLTYYPKSGYMNAGLDGVHMNHPAAHFHGKAFATMIKTMPFWVAPSTNPSNTGFSNTNPDLTGTGGTNGTGSSGQVATGCRIERGSGSAMTMVCSKETTSIFGISQMTQKIVCSGATASGEEAYFYLDHPEKSGASYAYNGTDGIEMVVPIKITAAVGVEGVYTFARSDVGSSYTTKDMMFVTGNRLPNDLPIEWLLRTEPLAVAVGNPTRQQMLVRMRVDGTTVSNGLTINIGQPFYRRITA